MNVRTGISAGNGLGDVVADVTHATGLDKLAHLYEQTTGKDCGCKERQEKLNQMFPLSNTPSMNRQS
jgi:hypothetical protein